MFVRGSTGGVGHLAVQSSPRSCAAKSLHLVFVLIPTLHDTGRAAHGEILKKVAALVDLGAVRPLLDPRRFALCDAGGAHRCVESGRPLGKVVIEVADL